MAAETIENGGGRLLRCSTFYEDFVKTVCTIQIAWSGSLRMVAALVEAGGGLFPTPVRVLELGDAGLRERGTGFRARSLFEGTETMLERGLIDEAGHTASGPVSYDDLLALWGIGPYAAAHMAVLQHDFSRIPVDSEVTSYCRDRYGIGQNEIDAHFEPWATSASSATGSPRTRSSAATSRCYHSPCPGQLERPDQQVACATGRRISLRP